MDGEDGAEGGRDVDVGHHAVVLLAAEADFLVELVALRADVLDGRGAHVHHQGNAMDPPFRA